MNRPESESGSHAVPADQTSARSADGSGTAPAGARADGLPAALAGYRIDGLLGTGGMGFVYRAHDPRADRAVALKIMRPELVSQPGAVERFLREARAAAKVRHDNVIEIWQVGEDAGVPFIAMPVLDGEPLNKWLEREPVPLLGVTLKVGRETADGLAAAHAHKPVHRDIKPANLWIEGERGADDLGKRFRRVKVLDFGLARPAEGDTQITGTGGVLGTPAYMSPEQARGDKIDHRSDLFSLGVVLYRMTTGAAPFAGATVMAVLTSLAVVTPPAPHALNPDLPPALSDLIMRLLEKDPEKRPAGAAEVAAALREIAKQRKAAPAPGGAPTAALDSVPMAASVSQSLPVVVYPQPQPQPQSAVRREHNPFTELQATELPAPTGEVAKPAPRPARAARTSRGVWLAVAGACALAAVVAVVAIKFLQKKPDPAPDETAKDAPKPNPAPPKPKDQPNPVPVPPKPKEYTPREVTEWVLSVGGKVTIKTATGERTLAAPVPVPAESFTVTAIDLNNCAAVADDDLKRFAALPLTSLTAHNTKIGDAGLAHLKGVTSLTWLSLADTNVTDKGLKELTGLKLTGLTLDGTKVTGDGLAPLAGLSELATLSLNRTNVDNAAVPHLAGLAKLKMLYATGTAITADGVQQLGAAPRNCQVMRDSDDRAAALWALSVGGKISLHHDNTPNFNVSRKEDLPPGPIVLTKVNVTGAGASANDAGLAKLKGLSALTYLNVAGSPITDDGLAHLRDLPALQTLDLKNTAITDAGLEHLATLTKLTVLFATDTKVSKEGVEKLAKALPKCRISWAGGTVSPRGRARAAAEWAFSIDGKVTVATGGVHRFVANVGDLPKGDAFTIQKLDFGANQKLTDAGLANLTDLNVLFLNNTPVTDAGLVHLKELTGLTELSLNNTAVGDEGLKHLHALTNLRVVYITKTNVTAAGVAALAKALPDCTIYSDSGVIEPKLFDNRAVAEWALANGGGVTLRQRDGSPQHVTAKSLPKTGAIVILRLDLGACKEATDANLTKLRGLHELTQLHLSATPITGAALANLKGLKKLTRVYINGTQVGDDGAAHLAAMPWLEHLDLGGTAITDDGLKYIGKLKNLTQLTLSGRNTTDAGLAHIAPLTELEWLRLDDTRTTDDGLKHLKQMTKLALLGLQGTRVTGTGLEHLAACPLTTLELTHLGGKQLDLARLDKLPGLRMLALDSSWVTDEQLVHLAHLKNLEYLRLSGTKVGDSGLKHLKGLPKLTSLSLENTGITDGAVDALKELTTLTSLGLSGTKVSAAGVEKLKAALPNCKLYGLKP
jgi:serine/threonine protein kinase/Leucine-rich repeat (LRR) protein